MSSSEMPIFLERLVDRKFEHAHFSERRFVQPYERCEICGQKIAERPLFEAVGSGMVSLFVIEVDSGPPWSQWEWVCESCFVKFQEVARWSLLSESESVGEASRPTTMTGPGFTAASGAEHEILDRYSVSWSLDVVIGFALTLGISLTEEEGRKFMALHMPLFLKRVMTFGDIRLIGLLQAQYLTPKEGDISAQRNEHQP